MHKQFKCTGCGKEFWTKQIKVYVFKERFCPKDKSLLNISQDNQTIWCDKCDFEANLSINPQEFSMVGIRIAGSSRNIVEAEKQRQKGTVEVYKQFVNEADLCQKCQNFLTCRTQAMRSNELINKGKRIDKNANVRLLSENENQELMKMEVYNKINKDYKLKMQEENRKKQEEVDKMIAEKAKEEEESLRKAAEESAKLIAPTQPAPAEDNPSTK